MEVKFAPGFEKSLKRLFWRERLAPLNPKTYYRKARHYIQRARRGYGDEDLWNANDHIARVVLAFLDHAETCEMAGYPMGLSEKTWDKYKAEIRWLMNEQLERFDTPVETMMTDAYKARMKKANRLFGDYWQALWD
jgi:hypothetical protein